MSQRARPQVVRRYLGELESALAGVPADVARDILDGVAEELAGLDPAAAATRIEELGDPMFIAAEARAESAGQSGAAGSLGGDADTGSRTESRGYVVFVSLLVAFGGVVVPILGWVVGLVLMWFSAQWRTWEKWVATAAVPAVTLLVGAVTAIVSGLRLSGFSGWHLLIFLALLGGGNILAGPWLLWRGLRRPAPISAATPQSFETSNVSRSGDATWYIVLASMLVAVGGIVLPLLGWVFGIAMVAVSKTWRTWEKWTATIAPAFVVALSVAVSFWLRSLRESQVVSEGSGLAGPNIHDFSLPLLADVWWWGLLLLMGLNVIAGVWLLWRGLHRK